MARCSRCGNQCADDAAVCPKCGAALHSSDVYVALDSLSGTYDSVNSAFVRSESVVVFKGETRKEAVNRITKGRSRRAFIIGIAVMIVFAAFMFSCVTNYITAAKSPKAVEYSSSQSAGTAVTMNVNTLVPVVETYYGSDTADSTVYCFARGESGTYAVVAVPGAKLDGRYKAVTYKDEDYNGSSSVKIQGTISAMEEKEKKEFTDTLTSAGMAFDASTFISVPSDTSPAVTGTILLLLALFVLGVGFIIRAFGYRNVYREAQRVKNAFDKGNF